MFNRKKPTTTSDFDSLNGPNGPLEAEKQSYNENLRDCLLRCLSEHLKGVDEKEVTRAILRAAGFDAAASIYARAEEEAVRMTRGISSEAVFSVGETFGLYQKKEAAKSESPEVL